MEDQKPVAKKSAKLQGKNGAFYIVNPSGAVHSVTKGLGETYLARVGYRLAEESEIKKYLNSKSQTLRNPIAKPYTTDLSELE